MDEGPQVFAPLSDENKNKKYQEEVPVYVAKWMPFKELMIMLQANLQEIGDRCVSVSRGSIRMVTRGPGPSVAVPPAPMCVNA